MLKVKVIFKNERKVIFNKVDECYLDTSDNMWRLFNDSDDLEIKGDTCGIEIDGDTVFIPHKNIKLISVHPWSKYIDF